MSNTKPVTDAMRDPNTPDDVTIRSESPAPRLDSTVGVGTFRSLSRGLEDDFTPPNRLVTIGDSLTQGFMSLAVFNTGLSFPAIIAHEMGIKNSFRYPAYPNHGGLPFNLESFVREMEAEFGDTIDWYEQPLALYRAMHRYGETEEYWENAGSRYTSSQVCHNLGIYGWNLRDTLSMTGDMARRQIEENRPAHGSLLSTGKHIAALRVLPSGGDKTVLDAAKMLGDEGGIAANGDARDGIETLIVTLGANCALGSILSLNVCWSGEGYDDPLQSQKYNVWRPEHFQTELSRIVQKVQEIKARHVIWSTVPHVTIAPYARAVGQRVRPDSRYFPYYTPAWISDAQFDPSDDPHITEQEARAVDSAIDEYNAQIAAVVRDAREAGKDWLLFDLCSLLDRMAYKRYLAADALRARPEWWDDYGAYPLPAVLNTLFPKPDSRFFVSGTQGRIQGGLFSLDGVHPTTIGYGIIAQELIRIMQQSGVKFYRGDGKTARREPVQVDFARLLAADTLMSRPPRSLVSDLKLLGWIDDQFDVFRRVFPHGGV